MLQKFRILALLEGISFLIILFITMPLKYLFENPMPNKIIGMVHGVLFLGYVVFAIFLKTELKWSNKQTAIILLCSIIPFGTFWADKKYLKN
ncbi:DUF3817 domain-containing protein [Aquimarina agarilytica]|uniref:DUF3817 domain-containing protein n=1 Tax=Aquimarina agarilytica TaxID=1087449 RepID=UPI0002880997|nr:DUF3817 domain-containing protein [Aquimarina agarilytica]